jgi:uncharacterized RDD family membrane protein YckC
MHPLSGKFSLRALLAVCVTAGLAWAQQPATPTEPTPAVAPEVQADAAPVLRRIDQAGDADAAEKPAKKRRPRSERGTNEPPFGDHRVARDSSVSEAVSILGSNEVEGEVRSDAVSVLGSTRVGPTAKVGGAAVAVLGNLSVEGPVKGEAVCVLGNAYVNAPVGGEVVNVLGQLELGPKAVIEGDVVAIGGKVQRHPDAIVRGQTVNVPILGSWGAIDWLVTWFKRCVLLGRPLAFGEHLGWAWLVAGSFLGLYLLCALIFPRGIERCVTTFETRPGYTILASVLTVFLSPVVTVLLAVTVVGLAVVPFMAIGLFGASLFGKAVMLAWLGRRFTTLFGGARAAAPVVAVLVGGGLVLLLYTVPFFGFMLYKLLSWLGLGVVVYTIALAMRREKPVAVAPGATDGGAAGGPGGGPVPMPPVTPVAPMAGDVAAMPAAPAPTGAPLTSAGFVGAAAVPLATSPVPVVQAAPVEAGGVAPNEPVPAVAAAASVPPPSLPLTSAGFVGGNNVGSGPTVPPSIPPPPVRPVAPAAAFVPPPAAGPQVPAATLPRADFGIRLAAMLLDLVIIGIGTGMLNGLLPRFMQIDPPAILLLLATYGAVMWKHKGTTIGGVVCGLKVVRLDDRPLDWATSWVRAGSCFLSMAVAGLGFLWVMFDDEKQSWHDKIAGTTVVRMPKGVPLI